MPNYEYECRKCEKRIEVFQKMFDDPLTVCEFCGGELFRVIFPCYGFVNEPKTLGTLAEKNTKNMSKEELERKKRDLPTKKTINRTPEKYRKETVETKTRELTPEEKRARTKDTKDVMKLSGEKLTKYIITGE